MWWLILIIIILVILLIVVVIVVANNSSNPPCPPKNTEVICNLTPCRGDLILLSCGDEVQLKECDSHGRVGNYQYYRVHKGQKTYIPFRPTRIQGDYKTCMIIQSGQDEVDYVIVHKKEDGELKPLPEDYRKVHVVLY
jgi:hypothetical protein